MTARERLLRVRYRAWRGAVTLGFASRWRLPVLHWSNRWRDRTQPAWVWLLKRRDAAYTDLAAEMRRQGRLGTFYGYPSLDEKLR